MNKERHILVTDGTSAKPSNIVFLLKLAGYEVSEFNDELEACNWLLQKDPTRNPAHLLLLNEPKPDRALFALLFQMRQRFPNLELLLVAPELLHLYGQITEIKPPVYQCISTEIHRMTQRIFRKDPTLTADQASPS